MKVAVGVLPTSRYSVVAAGETAICPVPSAAVAAPTEPIAGWISRVLHAGHLPVESHCFSAGDFRVGGGEGKDARFAAGWP